MIDIGGYNNKNGVMGNNNHTAIILTVNNGSDNKDEQITLSLQKIIGTITRIAKK